MFVGHYGVGFALKKFEKRTSLGILFLLVMLPDLLLYLLILPGVEKVNIVPGLTKANPLDLVFYPFSHGLLSNIITALLIILLVQLLPSNRKTLKWPVIVLGVLSHFFLDFITHIPDMPIFFGNPKVGLGLWNNVALSYTIETIIAIVGFSIYLFTMKEQLSAARKVGMAIFTLFLIGFNFSALSGTVPPDANFLAVANLVMSGIIIPLAYWLDRPKKSSPMAVTSKKQVEY